MKTTKRLYKDLVLIKTKLNEQTNLLKTIENDNNNKIVITQVLLGVTDIKNDLNEIYIHLINLRDVDAIFNKNDEVFYIDEETDEPVNGTFEAYSDDYVYSVIKVANKQVCVRSGRLLKREV
jgi:hypothetical protein